MDKFTESMRLAEAAGYKPAAAPISDMVIVGSTQVEREAVAALLADMRSGKRPMSATSPSDRFADLAANAADALRSLLDQLDAAKEQIKTLEAALAFRSGPEPVLPIDLTVQELELVRAVVQGMRAVRS